MWLCIIFYKCIEETLENELWKKDKQMHPLGQAIWGHIWNYTVEESQTTAKQHNVNTVHNMGGGGGEYRSTSGNCIMDSDVKGVGIRIRIHIR